jgi:NAD(P) transhydrogenase subunit beta
MTLFLSHFPQVMDLVAVLLLSLGIKGLSKVRSARAANGLAALAMGLAVVGLLVQAQPTAEAWLWIALGLALGGLAGVATAMKVPMTAMPETVALFNGCGGLASLLVALGVALFQGPEPVLWRGSPLRFRFSSARSPSAVRIVAMAKLQGWLETPAWTQSSLRHG